MTAVALASALFAIVLLAREPISHSAHAAPLPSYTATQHKASKGCSQPTYVIAGGFSVIDGFKFSTARVLQWAGTSASTYYPDLPADCIEYQDESKTMPPALMFNGSLYLAGPKTTWVASDLGAQTTWEAIKAPLPLTSPYLFILDGAMTAFGAASSNPAQWLLYQFNHNASAWQLFSSIKAPFDYPVTKFSATYSADFNMLFVAGGVEEKAFPSSLAALFDLTANKTHHLPDMNVERENFGLAAVTLGSECYVCAAGGDFFRQQKTGFLYQSLSSVECLEIPSQAPYNESSWFMLPALPEGRVGAALVAQSQGQTSASLKLIGGYTAPLLRIRAGENDDDMVIYTITRPLEDVIGVTLTVPAPGIAGTSTNWTRIDAGPQYASLFAIAENCASEDESGSTSTSKGFSFE